MVEPRSISLEVVLVVAGVDYDVVKATVTSAANSVPVANCVLATGHARDGSKITPNMKAFVDGAEAALVVRQAFSTGGDFPGLPSTGDTLFKGFVTAVGPSISGDQGSNIGVQISHADMTALMSGSTVQWSAVLSGRRYDPRQYYENALGRIKGRELAAGDGVLGAIKEAFTLFLKNAFETTNERMCQGIYDLNASAIEAVGKIGGGPLRLGGPLAADTSMLDFIATRLCDTRNMNIFDQFRALSADLMFDLVPLATGGVIAVPSVAFVKTAWKKISADAIFSLEPEFNLNSNVAGVALMSDYRNSASIISGCYVFPRSAVRAGVLLQMPMPGWVVPSYSTYMRAPSTRLNPHDAPAVAGAVKITPNNKDKEFDELGTQASIRYGDVYARELAYRARYQSNRATVSTYLRTDIGLLSTIAIEAPNGVDDDVSIYGRVEAVTLSIEAGTSTTTITVNYARTASVQELLTQDGTSEKHPIYSDAPWVGGPL